MATSLTHKYIPRTKQVEENLFIEEYYSNTDTKIYADGVEQTEISYINYSLQEQLKPIYGYASHTFDDIAIGNRIVTGILKTPIKNIDINDTPDDIAARANNSNHNYIAPDILDYNNHEQAKVDNTEWIGSTIDPNTGKHPLYEEDDETYEYRNKLMSLGYNVDTNSTHEQLIQAIKNFQRDNGIFEDGDLNYTTKETIDEELKKANKDITVTLPKGTVIYSTPNTLSGVLNTYVNEIDAIVLDTFEGDWVFVMTFDGIEGFVNVSRYPALKDKILNMRFER